MAHCNVLLKMAIKKKRDKVFLIGSIRDHRHVIHYELPIENLGPPAFFLTNGRIVAVNDPIPRKVVRLGQNSARNHNLLYF